MTCIHAGALSGLGVILNLFTLGLQGLGPCPVRPSLSKPMKGLGFPWALLSPHLPHIYFLLKEKKRKALKKKSVHYHVVIIGQDQPLHQGKSSQTGDCPGSPGMADIKILTLSGEGVPHVFDQEQGRGGPKREMEATGAGLENTFCKLQCLPWRFHTTPPPTPRHTPGT